MKIVGEIERERTIATGNGKREIERLQRLYGQGRWRKRKGLAKIQLPGGTIRIAETHWYEATGICCMEFKIKHFVD